MMISRGYEHESKAALGERRRGHLDKSFAGSTRSATADCPMTLSLLAATLTLPAPEWPVAVTSSDDRQRAFERVYIEGRWLHGADGAASCASGWSDVAAGQGEAALQAVAHVVGAYKIRSIADVPCGDGCFAGALLGSLRNRTTNVPPVEYWGVDIVKSLVERNRARLADATTHFIAADVVSGASPLPSADLVFSRQMLQHLCTEDALRFVRLVARSSARYALLTTFETDDNFVNTDIPCASGGYRAQDLTKPPFSLPPPLALFNERYPVDGRVALGLWSVRSLRHRLL